MHLILLKWPSVPPQKKTETACRKICMRSLWRTLYRCLSFYTWWACCWYSRHNRIIIWLPPSITSRILSCGYHLDRIDRLDAEDQKHPRMDVSSELVQPRTCTLKSTYIVSCSKLHLFQCTEAVWGIRIFLIITQATFISTFHIYTTGCCWLFPGEGGRNTQQYGMHRLRTW